jgi:hypothetical protein
MAFSLSIPIHDRPTAGNKARPAAPNFEQRKIQDPANREDSFAPGPSIGRLRDDALGFH